MRILLTNDDGILAPGIYALYKELKKIASVTIVAPDSERSSVSHAITLSHPLKVEKIRRQGKFFGYGVSGTPADCVKIATSVLLKKKPDLIISGINLGPNDGCSVFYSGTVAGAREGAIMGIPSIAVSLGTFVNPDFTYAAKFSAGLAKRILHLHLPKNTFLSVNVPNKQENAIKGVRMTRQGRVPIHGGFKRQVKTGKVASFWMTGKSPALKNDLTIDTYALGRDYITITPIHCDSTNYPYLKKLSTFKI